LQGYTQAIQRAGNKVQQEYIINSDFSYQGGAEGIKKLFALTKPPSGIFCHNYIMAIGAIWQAKRWGLTLPRDLSIIGLAISILHNIVTPLSPQSSNLALKLVARQYYYF